MLGYLPDLPDSRDFRYHDLLHDPTAPLPAKVDLRPLCPSIYTQGALNSCSANAIAALLEIERTKAGLIEFLPSRLFIYYNERSMEGSPGLDNGARIRDGIKSIAGQGVCHEEDWPYDLSRFDEQPPDFCYDEAIMYRVLRYYRLDKNNPNELKHCLAAGYAFVFGFQVYKTWGWFKPSDGLVPTPTGHETDQDCMGGHAVCAVGYDDARRLFIIRNSWGPQYGDQGYYYMSYDYVCGPWAKDFWTIRVEHDGAAVPVWSHRSQRAGRNELEITLEFVV
jgi:C1A family cysteine protease